MVIIWVIAALKHPQIASVSERDGNREIYIMNADGSGQTNLTKNPAFDGFRAWSPDGLWLVFGSNRDGNMEIYTMRVDGSMRKRLTDNPAVDSDARWQPNTEEKP